MQCAVRWGAWCLCYTIVRIKGPRGMIWEWLEVASLRLVLVILYVCG